MAELKPCPFCGRIPNTYGCKIYGYFVVCDCGIEQSRIYKQKCDAVKHWNRRKTENSSEKPNNYCDDCLYTDTCDSKELFYACTSKATISKMEQVDKDINVRSKDEPQIFICPIQNDYEALIEDEPQTETEIAKAIVHKMIDDAVIAEDAYPDLRQKMHDAVDEYEPQTDCSWR